MPNRAHRRPSAPAPHHPARRANLNRLGKFYPSVLHRLLIARAGVACAVTPFGSPQEFDEVPILRSLLKCDELGLGSGEALDLQEEVA